jgi:hypothetical protein
MAWSSSAVGASNNLSITVTSNYAWSWLRVTLPRGHTSAQPPVVLKNLKFLWVGCSKCTLHFERHLL